MIHVDNFHAVDIINGGPRAGEPSVLVHQVLISPAHFIRAITAELSYICSYHINKHAT